jgi:hypothetical protein
MRGEAERVARRADYPGKVDSRDRAIRAADEVVVAAMRWVTLPTSGVRRVRASAESVRLVPRRSALVPHRPVDAEDSEDENSAPQQHPGFLAHPCFILPWGANHPACA